MEDSFSRQEQVRFDLEALVNSVVRDFERIRRTRVTDDARVALIEPGIPYIQHVQQELGEGNVTIAFLQESIWQVLENGLKIARMRESPRLDKRIIKASMKRKCPYLFWC